MKVLWAEQALAADGWQRDVRVALDGNGRIAAIDSGCPPQGYRVGMNRIFSVVRSMTEKIIELSRGVVAALTYGESNR